MAPTTSLAEVGTPAVRELMMAVLDAEDAASMEWLAASDESFPTALEERPPSPVVRVWDALRAWDESGETFAVPCNHVDIAAVGTLVSAARAGLAPAKSDSDPFVRVAVRLSSVLADPSNAMAVFAGGVDLWHGMEQWRMREGREASAEREDLAPTVESLLEAGRTDMKCTIAMARGTVRKASEWTKERDEVEEQRRELRMPLDGEWLDEELAQFAVFWGETAELLGTVTSLDALRALHRERRTSALAHPASALVRMVGAVLLTERKPLLLEDLERVIRK